MTHPNQIVDVLDCGRPQETWETLREHLKHRAAAENEIAFSLEQDAQDALKQAKQHHDAAHEFYTLYEALRDAPVTFSASGIEAPSGGETTQIGSTVGESPTAESGDAQATPSANHKEP